ncbi:dihydrolipoyl dehydrogenase [Paenibacillus sp. CMAA1364]
MAISCDIAILGGGTGGYVAAIRAAQLGKDVVIIEEDKLGGTCLHRGCIPSKSLLRSAEVYADILDSESYGIETMGATLNFSKVQQRKIDIVEQLHQGVQYLMRKNKIRIIHGKGRVTGPSIFSPQSGAVAVELSDGEMETVLSSHLIMATGSRPRTLPGLERDGVHILSSDDALVMEQLPQSMIIIGGGAIGVEWASMLSDFGVQVTLVEAANHLLPQEDEDISKELTKIFDRRGITVLTGSTIIADSYKMNDGVITVDVQQRETVTSLTAEKLLVSIGRQANIENIGIENTDIRTNKGCIAVNAYMQTGEGHIYAIGDVIGGVQLAHAASHEGIAAVNHIVGDSVTPYSSHLIPRCVYTRPEVASVGYTQKECVEQGIEVKVGQFPFQANGKSLVQGSKDGFVKVVADAKTNDILGVQMIGAHVTELISEAALAQVLNATPWEVSQTIHPHPTLSEILGEAMLAVDGLALGM